MVEEESTTESTDEGAETTETHQQPEARKGDGVPPEMKAALRKANKEAETLRLRLKEFEDKDKSELEKAQSRAEAAEKAAAGHELAATRLAVAFEKGLTPAQTKYLSGSSRDELEARADEILTDFPVTASKFGGSADQGTRTTAPAPTVAERIAEAQENKDWATVGVLKAQQLRDLSATT